MSSFSLLDKEREEDLRKGKHLVLSVLVSNARTKALLCNTRTKALVDNGSEADLVLESTVLSMDYSCQKGLFYSLYLFL